MNQASILFKALFNPLLEDPLSEIAQTKARALQAELRNCRHQMCVASVDISQPGMTEKLIRLAYELAQYDIELFQQRSEMRNQYIFLFSSKAVPSL